MSARYEVEWAGVAENDLKHIIDYISIDSPGNALQILKKIRQKASTLYTLKQKIELAEISIFNIEARYDDYKFNFFKKANKKFALKYINKTKKILTWLNE